MAGPAKKEWTLYLIEAQNGFFYTGITKDLARRFEEHGSGKKAAKLFRRSPPKRILFSISGLTQSNALRMEYAVKQLDRVEKISFFKNKRKDLR